MSDPRIQALAVRMEPARVWTANVVGSMTEVVSGAGKWFVDTALHFGSLLSALMAPAVFSAYAFAVWSLAANLGWTSTFPFASGPLSNWLIWAGIAIAVHLASEVLRKRVLDEKPFTRES